MALFNSQNAREMAARSAESRRRAAAEAAQRLSELQEASAQAATVTADSDDYVRKRLACVRAQLALLDARMLTETDPQKLDRLASAQSRLAVQEQNLAGRPLPGSLRQPTVREKRRQDQERRRRGMEGISFSPISGVVTPPQSQAEADPAETEPTPTELPAQTVAEERPSGAVGPQVEFDQKAKATAASPIGNHVTMPPLKWDGQPVERLPAPSAVPKPRLMTQELRSK